MKSGGLRFHQATVRRRAGSEAIGGRLVVVLRGYIAGRGLELIPYACHPVRGGEVHELLLTAENAGPGSTVNAIAALGFMEFLQSGMLRTGDEMRIDGRPVGRLAGYDYTHMPNHMNIVLTNPAPSCGEDLGLEPEARVEFVPVHQAIEP